MPLLKKLGPKYLMYKEKLEQRDKINCLYNLSDQLSDFIIQNKFHHFSLN